MAKSFKKLSNRMSPEARKKAEAKTNQMLAEMPLQELRKARSLSQEQMAKLLKIKQASVSKLERRTDMYISTLRSYLKAMGGDLEIVAHFPDGEIRIDQFKDLDL